MNVHTQMRRIRPLEALVLRGELGSPQLADGQRLLAAFNARRLQPLVGEPLGMAPAQEEADLLRFETAFLERVRREVAPLAHAVPRAPDAFVDWFRGLEANGPGQDDPLFPWLAAQAGEAQMRWFLAQEVAGEAGFEDLLALTQVKMPQRAKLEMARNYWDEMGRGDARGMHGPMLARLAGHFGLRPTPESTVPEALALGNAMVAMASNRRYAFHSVGALGVIELTAPGRAAQVRNGLRRLGVPESGCRYFALHAVLDVKHADAWCREVLAPLVAEDGRRAQAIAEGALIRLWCGARCFVRYRAHFGI